MTSQLPQSARFLVTGGSGFIGTNLVEKYLSEGHSVASFDCLPPRNPAHHSVFQLIDLLDAAAVATAFAEFAPTHVFHLGARTDLGGATPADYAANSQGTANVIEALAMIDDLERVVFASSMLVCRMGYRPSDEFDVCPSTPYGESKVEMERIIRAAEIKVPWVIARPTSIWGPWFGVPYNDFFRAVIAGRYVRPGRREVNQSFGFVGNTVEQLNALATADVGQVNAQTFYLADYPVLEFNSWAERIAAGAGVQPIRRVPFWLLKTVAVVGDALQKLSGRPMPLTSFRLNNLVTENVLDVAPLKAVVGDLPFTTEQGIQLTLEWMTEHDGLVAPG